MSKKVEILLIELFAGVGGKKWFMEYFTIMNIKKYEKFSRFYISYYLPIWSD